MNRAGKLARIGAVVFASLGMLTLLADRLFQKWLLHKALETAVQTAPPEQIQQGAVSSIGIIGGADGPTAIFIASRPAQWWMQAEVISGLFAVLALICLMVWFLLRRRDNRR